MKQGLAYLEELNKNYDDFLKTYDPSTADAETRETHRRYTLYVMHINGVCEAAYEEGRQYGIAERLLLRNTPIDEVVEITKLTYDEVQDIKLSLNHS